MVITTTVLSTTPIQKINLKGSEINVSAAAETKISNPRIVKDSSLKFRTKSDVGLYLFRKLSTNRDC